METSSPSRPLSATMTTMEQTSSPPRSWSPVAPPSHLSAVLTGLHDDDHPSATATAASSSLVHDDFDASALATPPLPPAPAMVLETTTIADDESDAIRDKMNSDNDDFHTSNDGATTSALSNSTNAAVTAAAAATTNSTSLDTPTTYPVATFVNVRDWVITSVFDPPAPVQPSSRSGSDENINAILDSTVEFDSINSTAAATTTATAAAAATTTATATISPTRSVAAARNSGHDMMLHEEFIVVDGDLIAVPAHLDDYADETPSHGPRLYHSAPSQQQHQAASQLPPPSPSRSNSIASLSASDLCQQPRKAAMRAGGLRTKLSKLFQRNGPLRGATSRQSSKDASIVSPEPVESSSGVIGANMLSVEVTSDHHLALQQHQQQQQFDSSGQHSAAMAAMPDSLYQASTGLAATAAAANTASAPTKPEFRPATEQSSHGKSRRVKKEKKPRGVGWVQRRFKAASTEFDENHHQLQLPQQQNQQQHQYNRKQPNSASNATNISSSTLGCASMDDPPSHDDLMQDDMAALSATIPLVRHNSLIEDNTGLSSGLEPPSILNDDVRRFAAAANMNGLDGLYATSATASVDYRNDFSSPYDHYHQQPPIPMRMAHETSPGGTGIRATSVTASYVGTADSLVADGVVLPDASITAESFVEEDIFDFTAPSKKEDSESLPMSLVAQNADLKVDKAETPDVEAMLRRAVIETTTDLEAPQDSDSIPTSLPIPADFCYAMSPGGTNGFANGGVSKQAGKSDRSSIPLSQALPHHAEVHNDTLKVVMVSASSVDKSMVARKLRNCTKRPRKRTTLAVDVHEWRPNIASESATTTATANMEGFYPDLQQPSPVKCTIWDVQGATPSMGSTAESRSNFGTHPGTQSLFFSPQSLYLLCWDLACNNPKTNRIVMTKGWDDDDSDFDEDEDDDDDFEDDFVREEANRQADRALHADITHRVLSWFDCIARSGPKSAILPVALIAEGMTECEVKRRCDMMRILLEDHFHKAYDHDEFAPKLLTGTENSILCVKSFGDGEGIQQLQDMVAAIANDPSNSVFEHIGTPVPLGTVLVREAIQRFKEEHKLILLDHLMGELGTALQVHEIVRSLHFLSNIGEIMYFGTEDDEVLSRYVILSRKWLISALSCILRNDLKRELIETRRFMNMQCIYSDQKYDENEITRALVSGKSSSCPLLSDEDAKMLWQSMSFMREASDRYSNLVERSTTVPTMFYFLERLLVHSGVFLPLRASQENASMNQSEVFFVPSLLAQADPTNMWTYMTSESWMTTLCHSWLFRDGAPPNLMEHLTVGILRDLYQFTRSFPSQPAREPIHRVKTVPMGRNSFGEFVDEHKIEAIGTVRIHHVMCFESSLLVKIGTVFADDKSGLLRESVVEVFVALVDQTSAHAVASDVMRPCMQRIVISGKGQAGRHGHKLWKGGYKLLLDTVRGSLENMPNVDSQAVCPECLATASPRIASTWGWDVVLAAAQSGNPHVICLRGHRVNSHLICGTCPDRKTAPFLDPQSAQRNSKALNIKEALPSVVLVGVWDPASKSVISVGSGFIVDKKAGLIVTAGHVLFDLEGGSATFGKPYFGRPGARAVIGVIPSKGGKNAVFRYFAEIVAHDVRNVDACVLQIRSRLERDVDDKEGVGALNQPERVIALDKMPLEELRSLKLTKHFDLAESVRLLGYSQEGEGIYEKGKHISPSVEFVEGLIRRHFKATMCEEGADSDSSSTASGQSHQRQQQGFSPREEIVMHCLVNSGHSGGPCVNADGKVVGMLSRSDPVERDRCYLVPTAEIRPLILKAKTLCSAPRPSRITSMQTV